MPGCVKSLFSDLSEIDNSLLWKLKALRETIIGEATIKALPNVWLLMGETYRIAAKQ